MNIHKLHMKHNYTEQDTLVHSSTYKLINLEAEKQSSTTVMTSQQEGKLGEELYNSIRA